MTEFGSLDMVDEEEKAVGLPGVRKGDQSSRRFKPEVRVTGVRFAPTGRTCFINASSSPYLIIILVIITWSEKLAFVLLLEHDVTGIQA